MEIDENDAFRSPLQYVSRPCWPYEYHHSVNRNAQSPMREIGPRPVTSSVGSFLRWLTGGCRDLFDF